MPNKILSKLYKDEENSVKKRLSELRSNKYIILLL